VFLTILKNINVHGKDDIPYVMEEKLFETTSQPFIAMDFLMLGTFPIAEVKKKD